MNSFSFQKNKGFTLLFASLVVTILMSIGFTISNITLAQLILSSSGRESQFAFYNADSGLECALYYEYNATSTTGGPFFPRNSGDTVPVPSSMQCNGMNPTSISTIPGSESATTTFEINLGVGCDKTKPSFSVQIAKTATTTGAVPPFFQGSNVYIQSRGYNTCDTSSPKRVERGIYARFID